VATFVVLGILIYRRQAECARRRTVWGAEPYEAQVEGDYAAPCPQRPKPHDYEIPARALSVSTAR
jgi:hypothetical protein